MDKKLKDKITQYKHTFSTREGALVLNDLKASLGYGQNIFIPGQNREDTFFNLGRQSVINDIVNFITRELEDGHSTSTSGNATNKRKSKY
jgi:hypothetical protein